MTTYTNAARQWVEPLLAMNVGGEVVLRFLSPLAGSAGELGIVPPGANTYLDYPVAHSYVRELVVQELAVFGGQLRQGAREVMLSDAFVQSVAAAQGLATAREALEAAAGVVVEGRVSRVHSIQPLDIGEGAYAWQLLCDAPLETA
jgi:hypothetical protein